MFLTATGLNHDPISSLFHHPICESDTMYEKYTFYQLTGPKSTILKSLKALKANVVRILLT